MMKLPVSHEKEQTILEFWEKNKAEMANRRHWECKSNSCPSSCSIGCPNKTEGCSVSCKKSCWRNCPASSFPYRLDACVTIQNYSRFASRLDDYLPMKIGQVAPRDVVEALTSIQKEGFDGYEYSEATMENYRTFLRILFRFAQERGVAYDIMRFEEMLNKAFEKIGFKADFSLTKAEEKAVLKKLYHKIRKKPRSLTIWQQEKLLRIIRKKILSDGRYLAIAIILYAGLRPAECRGLLWKDIVSFQDHSDRHLINIYKTRNDEGKLQKRVKTKNGYRRIPVHCELERLIAIRLAFLKEHVEEKDLGNLPVCCIGNNFSIPCKEHDLSAFAMDVFSGLQLSMDDLLPYFVDAQLDEEEQMLPQHLTLYVLRRNFWTWLAALTQLDDMEKRYIMGHEMLVNKKDLRAHFNNENRLWEIAQHMDRCVLSKNLHKQFITHVLGVDQCVRFSNQGVVRIQVPKDLLANGTKLRLRLSTEMVGESVQMKVIKKPKGSFTFSASVDDLEPKDQRPRLNLQYENWVAHQNPAPPNGKGTAEQQENTVSDSSDADLQTLDSEAKTSTNEVAAGSCDVV